MTPTEQTLRAAYQSGARSVRADSLRPLTRPAEVPARLTGRRARSVLAPLATALAVTVTVAAAVTVPRLLTGPVAAGPRHEPSGVAPAVGAGTAARPFLAVIMARAELDIVSAATGAVTGRVLPRDLPGASAHLRLTDVAAVDGRHFLLFARSSAPGGCAPAYLYTLTISAAGRPVSVLPQALGAAPGNASGLAASADGGTVAFVTPGCGRITDPGQDTIYVLRHGRVSVYADNWQDNPTSLSLSADGSTLGFVERTQRVPASSRVSAWTLPTSARGGWAADRGHMVFTDDVFTYDKHGRNTRPGASQAASGYLSADGATLYLLTAASPVCCGWSSYTLSAYDTATGGRLRVLHTWPRSDTADPAIIISGDKALVWGINRGTVDEVSLSTGATRTFPPLTALARQSAFLPGAIAW